MAARTPAQGMPNASEAARETVREEAAVEVVACAEDARDHDETDAEVAVQVIDDNQEDNRDHLDAQVDTYETEQARGEGQGADSVAVATMVVDAPASPSQQEVPETVVDEHEQAISAYVDSEEEKDEKYQPCAAAGGAGGGCRRCEAGGEQG